MPLSRRSRLFLWLLGVPLLLAVAAGIALKLYFTEQRLRSLLIPPLEEASGRSIGLASVRLSLLPGLGVELDSLTVSNRPGPGFSARPMLFLERLNLKVRILPLLGGNLEVARLELERPLLLVEYDSSGRPNYRMDGTPAGSSPGGAAAWGALFSDVRLMRGRIEYRDLRGNSAALLEDVEMQLSGDIAPRTGDVRLGLRSSAGSVSYGTLAGNYLEGVRLGWDQEFRYSPASDLLTLPPGKAAVGTIPLSVGGTVSGLRGAMGLDITIGSDSVGMSDVLSLLPPAYARRSSGIRGEGVASAKIFLGGTVNDSVQADVEGVFRIRDGAVHYAGLPRALREISLEADFARTREVQRLRVTRLAATLGSGTIAARLTVTGFEDPVLDLEARLDLNLKEAGEFYPLEKGGEMTGRVKAALSVRGKPAAPLGSGTVELRDVSFRSGARSLRRLNGIVRVNNRLVESDGISMTLGESDLALSFWLRNYLALMISRGGGERPSAGVQLTSRQLFTKDILQKEASGPAASPGSPPESRSGLPLPGVAMNVTASVGSLVTEKFRFTGVRAAMKMDGGRIVLENFSCGAFGGSLATRGSLDLNDPASPLFDLSLDISRVRAEELLAPFTSFARVLSGSLTMQATLGGALDDTLGIRTRTLQGRGTVRVEEGALRGAAVNAELASLLRLSDLGSVSFRKWENTFTISDGRFATRDLRMESPLAEYRMDGSWGLDGTLDYALGLVLARETSSRVTVPGFAGEAARVFQDESGRLRLDFDVRGSADNPRVALNTRDATARASELIRKKAAEEAASAAEKLKKKGSDLLQDILKRKK
ncbi:MAG: AsmA-like C-terminal region-containing protein [Bacteroidota bacterium]